MRDSHIIDVFVEGLARKLSFDQSLARRVRREVEDHLWQAVERSSAGHERAAAAQAIAGFGDLQVLAAEFATIKLAAMTRQVSTGAIVLVGATLVAMKARLAWYGLAEWHLGDDLHGLATMIGLVDVYAFWIAAVLTVSGWIYLVGKSVPASNAALWRQLRHVVGVNCASATALTISVTCDGGLTALRLLGREVSVQLLIPLASMMAEVALIGLLIFGIGRLTVRMTRTASLLAA